MGLQKLQNYEKDATTSTTICEDMSAWRHRSLYALQICTVQILAKYVIHAVIAYFLHITGITIDFVTTKSAAFRRHFASARFPTLPCLR